jgi:DNA-binding PadR family transcriptional regulator
MALSADLLRGYTDTIILNRLREGDSYGYEINRKVSELSRGALELKEATLYTAFRRLESSGYIISYWGGEGPGARRRYYSITVEGRNRLAEDQAAWKETRRILDTLLNPEERRPVLQGRSGQEIPVIHVEDQSDE